MPELERKKFKFVEKEHVKRKGYRSQGIRPRLSKKQTLKNKIKRKLSAKRIGILDEEEDDRFPFHEKDLKYRHIKKKPQENSNAVIFFMMDVSGSMSQKKKFIARSFFFLLYQFLRYKYENVELIFISHTTEAKEVNENDFFSRAPSGGTIISSALNLMSEIVEKRFHPSMWNIYGFHCSDGDNWPEDVEKSLILTEKLKQLCQVYCFCEISAEGETFYEDKSEMHKAYIPLISKNFKVVTIESPEEVWPAFKRIFGAKL